MLKNTKNIKYIVIIIILAVLAGGIYYFIHSNQKGNLTESDANNDSSSQASKVNYDPPTEQDKQEAEDNKQKIVDKSEQTTTPAGTNVTPVITYAGLYDGQIEVGGYIPNIFEEGGICSATLTREGSSSVNKSVNAVRGANSVDCPQITISSSDIPTKGAWSVTLSYKSNGYTGVSSARSIEVK